MQKRKLVILFFLNVVKSFILLLIIWFSNFVIAKKALTGAVCFDTLLLLLVSILYN